jgi:hypothetical protein
MTLKDKKDLTARAGSPHFEGLFQTGSWMDRGCFG